MEQQAACCSACCCRCLANLLAADKPLLMEGKKTLYQRVLSIPEARLYEIPVASEASSEIVPFSVLYVYEKSE